MLRSSAGALWAGLLLLAGAGGLGAARGSGAVGQLSGAPSQAPALTFIVNNVFDVPANFSNDPDFTVCHTSPSNNICTLRAAVMNANRHAGGAAIRLPAQTYVLSLAPMGANDDASGDLNLSGTVSLVGDGAAFSLVDGAGLDVVFHTAAGSQVTLSGLTIRNGDHGSSGSGGGIDNFGQLTLSDSTLSGNQAGLGGGIFNESGAVLLVRRSSLHDNRAVLNSGGGIESLGTLTVEDSSLSHNQARVGGGLSARSPGSLTVVNSTISNNQVTGSGGGVFAGSPATFYHTTIAGNLADSQGTQAGYGGGIYASVVGQVHVWNSLFAYNYLSSTVSSCSGAGLTSDDYNYFDDAAGCTIAGSATHDLFGGAARLGPLADNGGASLTRALLPTSPPLDRIPPARCRDQFGAAPVPDQRGVARPVNGLCDMGAFEGVLGLPFFFNNLILNGDAEAAAGSPAGVDVGTPYWSGDVGQFTAVPYGSPGGFPAATDTVPANRGENFFAGGYAASSVAYQAVPVDGIAAAIDAGGVHLTLSADLGGFGSQSDNASVTLTFYNAGNAAIGVPVMLGPVTPGDRNNTTGFVSFSSGALVPAGTRTLTVVVYLLAGAGYNDGYADNLSLVLTPAHTLFLPLARR